jgi:protein-disulfide isomerase
MGEDNERAENMVALTVFAVIVILVVGFWNNWWGLFSPEAQGPTATTPISGEPVKGSVDAPVTIVEFSDFECPFCAQFYRATYPQLQELIDQGEVRLVFKNFPLTQSHPNAMDAAIAGECAYEQDSFWEYHDRIFQNQNQLGSLDYVSLAGELGLDEEQFATCMNAPGTESEVREDMQEGRDAGITGTPGFLVGRTSAQFRGERLVGNQPMTQFRTLIEKYS